jgi:hypothetical protein
MNKTNQARILDFLVFRTLKGFYVIVIIIIIIVVIIIGAAASALRSARW